MGGVELQEEQLIQYLCTKQLAKRQRYSAMSKKNVKSEAKKRF